MVSGTILTIGELGEHASFKLHGGDTKDGGLLSFAGRTKTSICKKLCRGRRKQRTRLALVLPSWLENLLRTQCGVSKDYVLCKLLNLHESLTFLSPLNLTSPLSDGLLPQCWQGVLCNKCKGLDYSDILVNGATFWAHKTMFCFSKEGSTAGKASGPCCISSLVTVLRHCWGFIAPNNSLNTAFLLRKPLLRDYTLCFPLIITKLKLRYEPQVM